jgi:hypothetical protein
MNLRSLLPLGLLLVGLLVGFGGGAALRPGPTTVTEVVRETTVQTATATLTMLQPTTVTQTLRLVDVITTTRIALTTVTNVATKTVTTVTTAMTTVYPAERGSVLVTDRGSGDKDTRPFTLETVSDLKITVRIRARADLQWVGLSWYLYNVEEDLWIRHGEVDEEEGVFEFYVARVPAGNWYIRILAANCNWEITVEKVT